MTPDATLTLLYHRLAVSVLDFNESGISPFLDDKSFDLVGKLSFVAALWALTHLLVVRR